MDLASLNAPWQAISALATLAAAIAALLAIGVGLWQIRRMQQELGMNLMVELTRRYDEVFETRNRLLVEDLSWESLSGQTSPSTETPPLTRVVNGDKYKMLRRFGGFAELCGALVKLRHVDEQMLFEVINFQPRLWDKAQDAVKEMRVRYEIPDLWINWEGIVKRQLAWKKKRF